MSASLAHRVTIPAVALILIGASPLSAQSIDNPFSDLAVPEVHPGDQPPSAPGVALRTHTVSTPGPMLTPLQAPDGSAPASDPAFAGTVLSSSLGSVAELLVGFVVGLEAATGGGTVPAGHVVGQGVTTAAISWVFSD